MKVLKFGGTSLGNAARMQSVANIVTQNQPVLVVLSAVSGTTNELISIVESIKEAKISDAIDTVESLNEHYSHYIKELYSSELIKSKANKFLQAQFSDLIKLIHSQFEASFEYQILAKGELISTELFHLYLIEQEEKASLIQALDFLRLTQEGMPDEIFLEKQLSNLISQNTDQKLYITQGFICRNAFGDTSNLNRGGSDYSASLFGAAINCEEIQIWTDIDGMHNNDPRYICNTQPVPQLSFDEAAELAYFGAKILHPSSIKPARKKNIPVRLLNTLEPSASGTLICRDTVPSTIKAVAAKSGITAINIRSSDMLQAPGFLRRIFEVFELYQTSIDMVTTSEVAVSVTIDNLKNQDAIVKTLNEFGHVEVDNNLSIVSVVGERLIERSELIALVINSLNGISIRMISYGGSAHNISFLVPENSKLNALKALHQGIFDV